MFLNRNIAFWEMKEIGRKEKMKVLILEDDEVLSNTMKKTIGEKYEVEQEFDGMNGFLLASRNIYDVIILDLMLPNMNGYEVVKKLRQNNIYTPILILTAKDGVEDKIKGFESGADDYLTKPFESRELLARIDAMIRRTNGNYKEHILQFKELRLNLSNRVLLWRDEEILLQGKQFELMEYLIRYQNTIVTKEQIFDRIWGFNSETASNVVEVYAIGIRKVLKEYHYDQYIKTIRGVGYMLSE